MRLAVFALLSLAAAYSSAGASDNAEGRARVTRDYALSGFERVKLAGSDDVRVIEGAAFAVKAEGKERIIDRLDIRVDGDTLIVSRKDRSDWKWSWHDDGDGAIVTVTMPVLRGAVLAGSGDMTVGATAEDRFEAKLAGSGDLNIDNVRAAETRFSLAGSGDLRARGKARTGDFSLAGSGDIDAGQLIAETVDISVAGSGDVSAHATATAAVSIIGSGDVTIAGNPKCTSSKIGSGEVRCS